MLFPLVSIGVGATLLLSATEVQGCGPHPGLVKRQAQVSGAATTTTRRGSRATTTAPPQGTLSAWPTAALASIGMTETAEPAIPVQTYAAGSIPPFKNAPPLPAINALNPTVYPALDQRPPLNSPEVKEWLSKVDLSKAPPIALKGLNGCSNTTVNADALAKAGPNDDCWWTCGGCTRDTDITVCPDKNHWGMSYDDGPSPYSPRLLKLLEENHLLSTFFVVGSRAISYPDILQAEHMAGHQLSVHTWSHPPLTELSNEEIVAELGWTRKAIKDITGVSPNTFRPPYGDVDDRVRYIAAQMNLTPIIWTSAGTESFDTDDWRIGAGEKPQSVFDNFEKVLKTSTDDLENGFIVLQHDLYQQSVDLAVNFILPRVINEGKLILEPISTCLGLDLSQVYVETATNSSVITSSSSSTVGTSTSAPPRVPSQGANASAAPSSVSSVKSAGAAALLGSATLCALVGTLTVMYLI